MPTENKSSSVKSLIENLEFAEAAELLQNALADRAADLSSEAQKLKIDIAQLESDIRQGILAREQVNIERARINRALINLNSALARFEADPNYRHSKKEKAVEKKSPRWIWIAAGLAALVLVVFLKNINPLSPGDLPETFDLDVRLHEPAGEQAVVTEGRVNLRLDAAIPQEPHALDGTGRAVFRDLSIKYLNDSVHLLYFPNRSRPFKITQQSEATISANAVLGNTPTIRFTIEFLPESTVFEAVLRDPKGRTVPAAQITVDATLHAESNADGYFKIEIPKPSGATAHFVFEKNGKRIFEQDLTVSPGLKPIPVE